jgi:hypothetical protein
MEAAIVFIIIGLTGGNGHLGPNGATPPFDVNHVINQVSHRQTTTGEFLIDTNVVYQARLGNQVVPAMAYGDSIYLVGWSDTRWESSFLCTRISQDGSVLDPGGIGIAGFGGYPAMAYDGTNFLVAWVDGYGYSIYGVIFSPTGKILSDYFYIAASTGGVGFPSAAFDGKNYIVVWNDLRNDQGHNNWDVYGARVTTAGTVLDTSGIPISTAQYSQYNPSVSFDGKNYFVVWTDLRNSPDGWSNSDIYGARITTSGTVLDLNGIVISNAKSYQLGPSVAFDGSNYLVVWEDFRNDSGDKSNSDIYGARVSPSGVVLEKNGLAFSTATKNQTAPTIAFGGTNYLVAWQDNRNNFYDIYGMRVASSGIILDPYGFTISATIGDQTIPQVIFDGSNYFTVWQDSRSGTSNIYGTKIKTDGSVLDSAGILLTTEANSQNSPSAASNGKNYLIAWQDFREGTYDIYCNLVDSLGIIFAAKGIPLSIGPFDQTAPSAASDGSDYFVVWNNNASIYGARVSQSGMVFDVPGVLFGAGVGSPSVTFGGKNYFVVWNINNDIYFRRIDKSGKCVDTSPIAITATQDNSKPLEAFDGTNYLVVWMKGDVLYGARVSQSGKVLDPDGFVVAIPPSGDRWSSSIISCFVLFNGLNYLVIWNLYVTEDFGNYEYYSLCGASISQSGKILFNKGIWDGWNAGSYTSPKAVMDGPNYLIVWNAGEYSDNGIYGVRVDTSFNIIKSFPISTSTSTQLYNQVEPAIANGPGNQSLIVWSGWTDSINGRPVNAMRIWGKLYPFPEAVKDAERRTQDTHWQLLPASFRIIPPSAIRCPRSAANGQLRV